MSSRIPGLGKEFIIRPSKCCRVPSREEDGITKKYRKSDGRDGLGGKVKQNFKHTEYEGIVKNPSR